MNQIIRESLNHQLNEEVTEKDLDRMRGILTKSGGDFEKMKQLAQNMANKITSQQKAEARSDAAKTIFGAGKYSGISDIFSNRAEEIKQGVNVDRSRKTTKKPSPEEQLPDNPEFDEEELEKLNQGYKRPRYRGFIYLPTYSAIALWEWEITGQLSDGKWENTRPDDHWMYWVDLYPKIGKPENVSKSFPKKTSYGLTSKDLLEVVGDRMLNFGRFGKAIQQNVKETNFDDSIIEYLPEEKPEDFETFKEQLKDRYSFIREESFNAFTKDVFDKFYNTQYTEKDMRKDLRYMKEAMKNVR